MQRSTALPLLFSMLLLLGVFAFVRETTTESARSIIAACDKESNHAFCYEREVAALYPEMPLKAIFAIVREIRRADSGYQFCHVLAHKLGERIVADNPDAWLDAIPLNPPDGLCSNGFMHGVIGGRFRAEVLTEDALQKLIPDFSRACEPRGSWNPSELDKAICYHGLGHLYVFLTDADIPRSLQLCKKTTSDRTQRMCLEGVFMQIYQPLEPDDFLLIERMSQKPSTTTVRTYCSQFGEDQYEGACLRESWPYAREGIVAGVGIDSFCEGYPNQEQQGYCYDTAFAILGRMSLDNPGGAVRACKAVGAERRLACLTAVAQAVLEEDRSQGERALSLCESAPVDLRHSCAEALVLRAEFIFGSNTREYKRFCATAGRSFDLFCTTR
ncbi:MAG: hypothetical protein HYS26_04520 [Candidatus Kaiserbacteria bacterium]|nr:MAG: hypothetical protein HYS26_04520 [Candidatus Kaiserbacteria bacterium]